ncbi:MAG: hypothetical protein K5917_06845, partial [Clostridiales bacterium]|nr:hypothetical protein [Clostridiales bacterium]
NSKINELQNQKKSLEEKREETKKFYEEQIELYEKQSNIKNYENKYCYVTDYQKELDSRKKDVRELEMQLKILENDTSAKAEKRKRELRAELSNAQEALKDYSTYLSCKNILENLDNQRKNALNAIDEQIKDCDKKINELNKTT